MNQHVNELRGLGDSLYGIGINKQNAHGLWHFKVLLLDDGKTPIQWNNMTTDLLPQTKQTKTGF